MILTDSEVKTSSDFLNPSGATLWPARAQMVDRGVDQMFVDKLIITALGCQVAFCRKREAL
jgi:hypothetical protein